ncbi:aldo/keto reductase [Kozakia baliensis]|uniref:Oxidoreductase n=1 Tax=Kozakia baliensis TaxID=153496 RepID=A0A1D8UQK8_9PROT|nr:aldo/keto reductase [Kozakia baliensis]AOX15921.1 oxidoreductase [Kozakia baliensis]GBR27526.1 aldo/keto reductase [Kozakia baliensis NRIC 0488]GEL64192.1 oxidoreductase [Kozakia baliensis]
MRTVKLKNGRTVPALGMGTWNIGDSGARRADEIASLQAGIEAGMTVVDTAEMYGNGRSETLVGEAIADLRDDVYLVSKVTPSNASYEGVQKHCRASLKRLGTDRLDLYLLHWRSGVPLSETVRGMEQLQVDGLIEDWGVSNFDVDDMDELDGISDGCVANQVLYNLEHRGVEFDLLGEDREREVVTMAYSPLGQGGELLTNPAMREVAKRHETSAGPASAAQIALAWVLRQENILAIPKAGSIKHLRENALATEIELSQDDLKTLDAAFPPPKRKMSLAMI